MQDKQKLIHSMSNLINHVKASRKNQQEIFATLSATDFRKILSNFDDPEEKIRKNSLLLLSELLSANVSLQRRFCGLTNTADCEGKIVLNSRLPKTITANRKNLQQVLGLLKEENGRQTGSSDGRRGAYWYIDEQCQLQMGSREGFVADPLYCVVGVWVETDGVEKRLCEPDLILEEECEHNNPSRTKIRLNKSNNGTSSKNRDSQLSTPISQIKQTKYGSMTPTVAIQSAKNAVANESFWRRLSNTGEKPKELSLDYSFKYIKPSSIGFTAPSATFFNRYEAGLASNRAAKREEIKSKNLNIKFY